LRADGAPGFTNLLRQDDPGDGGTDKSDASQYGGRLIYGRVNFVIGSLRKIGLRDGRDAHHGAHQQEQNERPSIPHYATSANVKIAA
jgi:hypothetical protein